MKLLAIGSPRAGVDVRGEVPRYAHEEMRALWQLYGDGAASRLCGDGASVAGVARGVATSSTLEPLRAGAPATAVRPVSGRSSTGVLQWLYDRHDHQLPGRRADGR
jgi:hypothetical protein